MTTPTNNPPQETVQTVQEKGLLGEDLPVKEPIPKSLEVYEIARDDSGFHWALWSKNGQILARSAKPYASRQQAVAAIRLVQKKASAEKIVIGE